MPVASEWTDAAELGYYAQDHAHKLRRRCHPVRLDGSVDQGEQMIRGTLGRMLFSNDEILKSVKVISGGESKVACCSAEADFAEAERADGRTDQPLGHGIDRGAEPGAGNYPGTRWFHCP